MSAAATLTRMKGALGAAEIKPAFQLEKLRVAYHGTHPALEGVDAVIPERGVYAILGPSGCGKTTLLRCLNRSLLQIPGAAILGGRVLFRGEDLDRLDPLILRKRVGLVLQKPVAFPMSIRENVLFGVRFHGNWRGRSIEAIVQDALEQAGLWTEVKNRLREHASRLSTGQLQRLCVARLLANEPEALLLDEPCGSLDPISTLRLEETLSELATHIPVVIVTHNVAQARRIGDQALFLIDGEVAEVGRASDVLQSPSDPRVRDFVEGRRG